MDAIAAHLAARGFAGIATACDLAGRERVIGASLISTNC
jgi:hypothetical protein